MRVEDLQLDFDAAHAFIDANDWSDRDLLDLLDHHAKSAEQANELVRAKLHEAWTPARLPIHRTATGLAVPRVVRPSSSRAARGWGDTPTELYRVFDLLGLTDLDELLLRKHGGVERSAGTNGITIVIPPRK
ncbi:MAG: hypothetical protein M5U25_11335 [Planctomycetota bacterium]|nr:hypothetical protein [Planctomycetota bacterium]